MCAARYTILRPGNSGLCLLRTVKIVLVWRVPTDTRWWPTDTRAAMWYVHYVVVWLEIGTLVAVGWVAGVCLTAKKRTSQRWRLGHVIYPI